MNEIALKDIHLPELPTWWPPAPGWWMLGILLILLIIGFPRLLRWIKQCSNKKLALREFQRIRKIYDQRRDQKQLVGELSILLRRTIIGYYGRANIAGLTGEKWIRQLNALPQQSLFSEEQQELLINGQYRRDADFDVEALLQASENWIKALPRNSRHVPA